MKYKLLRFTLLLLLLAMGGVTSVWADEDVYTFTSKAWKATLNGEEANWTSNKDGGDFINNGVQVTKSGTGASATSPISYNDISKIVVTYNTNKSAGAGTIHIKVGNNEAKSKEVIFSGSADGRSANFKTEFDYSTAESGNVTITVNTTTNSLYICSIAITYGSSGGGSTMVALPTFDPQAGTYETPQNVTIATATDGATIYYTTDGTDPTTDSEVYSEAIEVSETMTIKAFATMDGLDDSSIATAEYTIALKNAPKFTITGNSVEITAGEGTTIYYTTDGTDPTNESEVYNGPFSPGGYCIIKAIAYNDEGVHSKITSTVFLPVNPSGVGSNYFEKVKSLDDLADGDGILFVSETKSKAMSTTQNDNNRGAVDVAISAASIDQPEDVQVVTLCRIDDKKWAFYTGEKGFLYAASSSSNNLKTTATPDADGNAFATISFTDAGDAVVLFQGTNTRNLLRYNDNSKIFSCYASTSTTGSSIQIYKEVTKPNLVKATFADAYKKIHVGDTYTNALTLEPSKTVVTFTSSDPKVATIDENGEVTAVGLGSAKITLSWEEQEIDGLTWNAGETSYMLYVVNAISDGVFDFTNYQDYGSGLMPDANTYITEEHTFTAGNVSLTVGGRYRWFLSNSGNSLRLYKQNVEDQPETSFTISKANGNLGKISITGANLNNMTASNGTYENGIWTGDAQSVTFTYSAESGTITINTIIASDPTNYSTIDDMLYDLSKTGILNVKYDFDDVLVSYVYGKYTYIADEKNDGLLLYGDNLGLKAGDRIKGTIYGTMSSVNNRPQLSTTPEEIKVTVISSDNAKRPKSITPKNLDKYVNQYVRIENAQYKPSDASRGMEKALGKTLYFTVGDEVFIAYNQFNIDLSALEEEGADEKLYSLTGYATVFNNDYELYLTEPLVTDSVISWDFQNKLPESIVNTHIEGAGATGTVESTKKGVVMQVLGETAETNIKLAYNEQGYAQFNQGTVLRVPVEKAGDVVTVTSYPGQYKYNVGGTAATADVTEHVATTGEGAKGYVEVIATSTAYLYCITSTVKAPAGLVTANDKEVTATFKFDQGTDGQKADFGADANMFVNSKVTYGSNLSIKGKDSKGWSETVFGTAAKETTAGESNAIRFLIQPKNGLTFQPTKVSFRSTRFGTDGGLLNISWLNSDGTTAILDSDKKPNRDNETPHESEFSYDISHVYASTGACGLVVNLFSLDPGKTVGLADIVIEGTMNGTEVEIPVLASFKANGKVYEADGLFEADGEQYTATVMLSKKEKMISTANPVTDIVASTGTVNTDDIRYEAELTKCLVTIPVSLSGKTTNYVINFVHKPDFTLSYISPEDGQTVLTTQQVEMDAPIGEFAGDAMSNYTIPEGYKMRGWFAKPVGSVSNRKFTVEDIVTSDLKLYGIATEIEGPSTTKKYTFDLTDQYFYAEDHEAFNPTGTGKFHDNKHGWSFANGDLIDLLVGEKANISVGVCQYSAAGSKLVVKDAEGQTIGSMDAQADADGTTMTYTYQGKAGKVTLAVEASGAIYLHNVKIANTADINYDKQGDWYFVKAGNAASLLDVLEVVNGTNAAKDAPRAFIFLPDGTYDLGATVKTAISGHNISIIGQSADGTIITTKPDKSIEGLGSADMLQASSTNLYLQDLTLKNALDYYNAGSAGRAAVLQDAGTRTVGKNVRMLSFQDTYYSSNNSQQAYWETCDIHGTVDFICGGGDIRFQNTTISLEPRALDGKGSRTITAPTTKTEFGYVFDGCKVVDLAEGKGNWNFGRTWQNTPVCVYLNTTLDDNAKSTLISTRWIEKGMNNKDPKLFGEYGTKDENGTDITPKSNIIKSHGGEFETILSAEQAAGFAYNKMFTDWDPASLTKQAAAPAGAKYDNGTVSWTGSSDAIAYAVFKNGEFVGLTEANSFNITIDGSVDGLTVRAANKMGGLGEAAPVAGTTGIEATQVADGQDIIYNLQGIRLNKAGKGLYIINGRKVVK